MYGSTSRHSPWFDKAASQWRYRQKVRKRGGGAISVLVEKDAWDALARGAREIGTKKGAIEYALMNTFGPDAD
jgi:hypothetical protein